MAKKKPVKKAEAPAVKTEQVMPTKEAGLTALQEAFVREYLIDKCGTKAAIRAGYEEKHAASQAYQLLHKSPAVIKAVAEATSAQYKRLDLTADRILHELMLLATVDIGDAYDSKGNLLPMHLIPEHIRRCISGVEVEELFEGYGDDRVFTGLAKKLKTYDKKGALDTLAKHLKLLKDLVEIKDTTGLAKRLAAARKRKAK